VLSGRFVLEVISRVMGVVVVGFGRRRPEGLRVLIKAKVCIVPLKGIGGIVKSKKVIKRRVST